MRTHINKVNNKKHLLQPTKILLRFFLIFCIAFFAFFFTACKEKIDYFSYVSELRDNIFLAENDGFCLRIYSLEKEYPYASDGVKRETEKRTEVRFLAPSGSKTSMLSFTIDGKEYGGEMSYDNVKAEYYYSCTLDVSTLSKIECAITYGEDTLHFSALTVKTESTLSPQKALETLRETESELFDSLTDKYGFAGEIYLRLLCEDSPYYYIGVIDRNGNTTAFLMNGETGKVLARRQG